MTLPYSLTRTVLIEASRETVFGFFQDTEQWASWWGAGSRIEARVGGAVRILYPGGVEVLGEVLEIAAPDRLVFTYGFASGTPIPAGSSRVAIRLEAVPEGTRLHLLHEFGDPKVCQDHIQGWRYQLSLFSNAVANRAHGGAGASAEAWYRAWAITDDAERLQLLASICADGVRFQDRYSNIEGVEELSLQIGAVHRFMPGATVASRGAVRHCQGTVLSDFAMTTKDGAPMGNGTNVFRFDGQGRIRSVTGIAA